MRGLANEVSVGLAQAWVCFQVVLGSNFHGTRVCEFPPS